MTNDIAGTPMFMAPEQHIGAAADARTDQFGFCATLHFALHGRPPFAGKTVEALLDAKRQGRVELPAEHRVPAWVQRILARGLSPSPEDRFASMTDLVDALARDPGRTRRRLALLAGGIASVGAGLLGQRIAIERRADRCADEAVFASTWNDDVASGIEDRFVATQLPYAVQSWTSTRRILDARWQTWATERAHACGDETLPAPELQEREACLARRRGELESLVDLFTLADAGLVEHSVAAAGALAPSELCRDPRWRDSDGEARPQADLALLRAEALLAAGRLTDAAQAAADLQQTAASDEDAGLRVRATLVLARTHVMEGDYVGAEDELHHALLAAERAGAHGLGDRALALLVSVVGYHQHRPGEAMRYAELARVRIEASGGSPVVTAMLERGIAMVRQSEGRFDEALTHYEHALAIDEELYGSDHPESTNTLNGMGAALYFAGQHAAAEARLRESLQRTVAVLGENHPRTARAYGNLAGPVLAQDRGDEAVELSTRALAIFRRLHEDSHPVIAETMTNLANAMVVAHRPDEALTTVDEALALLRRRGGGDPEARVLALFVRADALHQLHRLDQELAVRREAVTLAEAELGTPHARLADALVGVAASYEDLGRPREALPFHERGAAMLARTLGAEHPRTLEAQLALAATRRLVAAADVRDPEDGRAR
jgi:tetratricopeptide (TPR) repeat protein